MGAPRWPPYPPPLGTPRHSRVAPRRSLLHARPPPWGPRDGPHTPHRSARPATAGSPLVDRCFTSGLLHGGPEIAPIPPPLGTPRHSRIALRKPLLHDRPRVAVRHSAPPRRRLPACECAPGPRSA